MGQYQGNCCLQKEDISLQNNNVFPDVGFHFCVWGEELLLWNYKHSATTFIFVHTIGSSSQSPEKREEETTHSRVKRRGGGNGSLLVKSWFKNQQTSEANETTHTISESKLIYYCAPFCIRGLFGIFIYLPTLLTKINMRLFLALRAPRHRHLVARTHHKFVLQ